MSAAVEILVLIDELDDLIHNAKPVPLTDQVRIEKDAVYAILDRMRKLLPDALIQAHSGGEGARALEQGATSPLTPLELEEAARSLRQLVERVKFSGEAFRLDAHGIPMAELRPPRD